MLQAELAKFLSVQVLLDPSEMEGLVEDLAPFFIFNCSAVGKPGVGPEPLECWLRDYLDYVQAIKDGQELNAKRFRLRFSEVWTTDPASLQRIRISDDKELLRPKKPCIQLQHHQMALSREDGKLYSMARGKDLIRWGLQFSYPQVYQDSETKEIFKVDSKSPNSLLFRKLQRWLRAKTLPTTFFACGIRQRLSVRIGKACLAWIHGHPDLNKMGLTYGES